MEKWVGRRIRTKCQTHSRVKIALIDQETENIRREEDERRGFVSTIMRPIYTREHFENFCGATVSADNETNDSPSKYISYWYRRYLCQKFSKYGDCEMNGCKYMHTPVDLSQRMRFQFYKMYLCPDYHQTGYCVLGYKCVHIHDEPMAQLGYRIPRPILGRGEMLQKNIDRDRIRLMQLYTIRTGTRITEILSRNAIQM